jgi:hypothetical protein
MDGLRGRGPFERGRTLHRRPSCLGRWSARYWWQLPVSLAAGTSPGGLGGAIRRVTVTSRRRTQRHIAPDAGHRSRQELPRGALSGYRWPGRLRVAAGRDCLACSSREERSKRCALGHETRPAAPAGCATAAGAARPAAPAGDHHPAPPLPPRPPCHPAGRPAAGGLRRRRSRRARRSGPPSFRHRRSFRPPVAAPDRSPPPTCRRAPVPASRSRCHRFDGAPGAGAPATAAPMRPTTRPSADTVSGLGAMRAIILLRPPGATPRWADRDGPAETPTTAGPSGRPSRRIDVQLVGAREDLRDTESTNGASRGVARMRSSTASRTPASRRVACDPPSRPSPRRVSGTSAAPTAPATASRGPIPCCAVTATLRGKRCWRTVTDENWLSVGARTPAVAATPSHRQPTAARASKRIGAAVGRTAVEARSRGRIDPPLQCGRRRRRGWRGRHDLLRGAVPDARRGRRQDDGG